MGFFIASADSSGALISTSAELLTPGPAEVDYPLISAGRVVDTAAGTRIKQLPPHDPRPRAWIWNNIPTYRASWERLLFRLEALVSTTRQKRGLSPYVYFKDTETRQFGITRYVHSALTDVSSTTFTDNAQTWTTDLVKNGTVEIVSGTGTGQRRSILTNSSTIATIDRSWDVTPAVGAVYDIEYFDSTWIRVRVLNFAKKTTAHRAISYESIRLEFTVDDPAFNYFG